MKVKVFLSCLREKTRDKRIVTTIYKICKLYHSIRHKGEEKRSYLCIISQKYYTNLLCQNNFKQEITVFTLYPAESGNTRLNCLKIKSIITTRADNDKRKIIHCRLIYLLFHYYHNYFISKLIIRTNKYFQFVIND